MCINGIAVTIVQWVVSIGVTINLKKMFELMANELN